MLEKALAGILNLLVKFSTLQEYGVDRVFYLEQGNVGGGQRNVVFLARSERAEGVMRVAGMLYALFILLSCFCFLGEGGVSWDLKVGEVDRKPTLSRQS